MVRETRNPWVPGWKAIPEEQRVKFMNLAERMKLHPNLKEKYEENMDKQNHEIAFKKIFDDVMDKQRKKELDLYRLMYQDGVFKQAMQDTIKRMLAA